MKSSMDDMDDTNFQSNKSPPEPSAGCGRQQSLQLHEKEERFARLLIEEVLPPFTNSLHLKALVVYQADQAKTDSFLMNKTYFRSGADNPTVADEPLSTGVEAVSSDLSEAVDEHTPLSDSGFIEPSTRTPKHELSSSSNLDGDLIGFSGSETSSKRKRKLYRPCKIPQSDCERVPTTTDSLVSVAPASIEQPLATASPLRESSHASYISVPVSSPSRSTVNDTANSSDNRMDPCVMVDVLSNQNGITQDGIVLPVSAVTLLPRLSVFPVSVLSTLPRPILPRGSLDKSVTVSSLMCLSALKPSTVMTSTNTSTVSSAHPTVQLNAPSPIDVSPPPKRIALSPVASKIQRPTHNSKHSTNIGTVSISSNGDSEDNPANRRYGKSFVCNQCHKDFASLSLLCTHTFSVHRGFRCTICKAQFTQRSNLQRHSLRHVGFKPFICKVCDKAYYRKDHLVRHIEVSHPGCDPRISLTVKLSSAECLDYLEKQHQDSGHQEGERDTPVRSFVEATQDMTNTVISEPAVIKLE